jgi:hypothetical protein
MALTDDDKRWISEQLERVETKLLTEFHRWASPNEARQRRYSTELHEFEMTLENHEDRLKKLEGGPHGKT